MTSLRTIAAAAAAGARAAQPAAAARTVAVRPDALLVAAIGLAGEPGAVQAVSVACRGGGAPLVLAVPDPRDRDSLYALLDALSDPFARAWDTARDSGGHLQVVVPSGRTADLLEQAGERARSGRTGPVRRLGAQLAYLAERRPVAGQQALVVAPDALGAHVATGQAPGDDRHLGALLEWVRPGAGGGGRGPLEARIAAAEKHPAGPGRDPRDDRRRLAPAMAAHRVAAASGDPAAADRAAARIERILLPDLVRQQRLLAAAADALDRLRLADGSPVPDLPDPLRRRAGRSGLDQLRAAEARAFRAYAAAVDRCGGRRPPDGDGAEIRRLLERDAARHAFDAAVVLGDPVQREQAVIDGRAVRLRVVAAGTGQPAWPCPDDPGGPDGTVDFMIGTACGPAPAGPGETWFEAAPGAPEWRVRAVATGPAGDNAVVLVRPAGDDPLAHGAGVTVELVGAVPDWHGAGGRLHAYWQRARIPVPPHLDPRRAAARERSTQ